MENNKQQTAVEWLAKSYVDLLTKLNNEEISLKEFEIQYIELLEQAKEMEKRQIVDAWSNGFDEDDRATSNPFKYYNETYGDDK
jgi:predicted GNAT superfamily acetyltransferase